jgi:SAM-dependent methyltransferase
MLSTRVAGEEFMIPNKIDNLLSVVRCTCCGAQNWKQLGDVIVCFDCNSTIDIIDGALNFLDSEMSSKFRIAETENVSDHPYDGNAKELIKKASDADGLVLDCGSGYKTDVFDNVIQLEIVNYPNVDVLAVNQNLPFADESFDVVFSADVLEHVDDPFLSALEIFRVLKPGGHLYVDIPFLQGEHGYPNHYFNATREGLLRLFPRMNKIAHHVPISGHPIFALRHIIDVYRTGLPPEIANQFLDMSLNRLLSLSDLEWLEYGICTELDPQCQWLIASTTQAILQKDMDAASSGTIHVGPQELPGFQQRSHAGKALEPVADSPIVTTESFELSQKEKGLILRKRSILAAARRFFHS